MADRSSWLESKHLEESIEGAEALRELAGMSQADRDALIGQGDRFAAHSVSLAHRYLIAAAQVYRQQGSRSASDWETAANVLLRPDGSGRESVTAFFDLDPSRFAAMPEAVRKAWLDAAARIIDASRRLGSRFVSVTGPPVFGTDQASPDLIDAWSRAITETLDNAQWRGEFVAAALIDSSPGLITALDTGSVAAWAVLLQRVAAATRSPKLPEVPEEFRTLPPQTVSRIVSIAVQARDAGTAAVVLRDLARAAKVLPQAANDHLLEVIGSCIDSPALGETLSLIPGVVHGMAGGDIDHAYSLLDDLSATDPELLIPYLRTIDRALEEGGREGIQLWVERGLEITRTNRKAGLAHFRLESRTSHAILTQHSASVSFEEVEGLMQRFLMMMSRRSFQLSSGPGVWFRPPLAAPEDTSIHFPERVDLCDTVEDNQLFYKLTAAHIAGRWEYGTYDLDLDRLAESAGYVPDAAGAESNDIMGLIESFPNPLLAASLFILLDGVRIDAALTRDFKGLADDLDRLGRFYADNPPPAAPDRPAERFLEALFMMSVGRRSASQLEGRLRRLGRALEPAVEKLRSPDASAYDSAAMLLRFYAGLALAQARPAEEYDVENMIAQISGATVIDPLEHLDGDTGTAGMETSTAGGSTDTDLEGDLSEQDIQLSIDEEGDSDDGGTPLTPEELRALIESGLDLKITSSRGGEEQSLGLYITDLLGKLPAAVVEELREHLEAGDSEGVRAWLADRRPGKVYVYDEWDHHIRDYRRRWCRLTEHEVGGDSGEYFSKALSNCNDLLQNLKREFQLMKPEQYRKVRGMEHGEEVDLAAAVDAHADRRSRQPSSDRLYIARQREERDIATLFLLDMSASTDEPLAESGQPDAEPRRVIDLTKDTIAIMSKVIEEIGDAYAIYGFSGHGRDNVEYFHVKSFNEKLSDKVKARLGGIEPRRSTRMGTALRHSAQKLARVSARSKYMILLSDGFPQDFDYGDDRRSNVYGIQDTMTALQEMEDQAVRTFCITVDPAGHDYLREMCPESRYAVIEDIRTLPEQLPRIYRMITRG